MLLLSTEERRCPPEEGPNAEDETGLLLLGTSLKEKLLGREKYGLMLFQDEPGVRVDSKMLTFLPLEEEGEDDLLFSSSFDGEAVFEGESVTVFDAVTGMTASPTFDLFRDSDHDPDKQSKL